MYHWKYISLHLSALSVFRPIIHVLNSHLLTFAHSRTYFLILTGLSSIHLPPLPHSPPHAFFHLLVHSLTCALLPIPSLCQTTGHASKQQRTLKWKLLIRKRKISFEYNGAFCGNYFIFLMQNIFKYEPI